MVQRNWVQLPHRNLPLLHQVIDLPWNTDEKQNTVQVTFLHYYQQLTLRWAVVKATTSSSLFLCLAADEASRSYIKHNDTSRDAHLDAHSDASCELLPVSNASGHKQLALSRSVGLCTACAFVFSSLGLVCGMFRAGSPTYFSNGWDSLLCEEKKW